MAANMTQGTQGNHAHGCHATDAKGIFDHALGPGRTIGPWPRGT
jgi:hypothetical protein